MFGVRVGRQRISQKKMSDFYLHLVEVLVQKRQDYVFLSTVVNKTVPEESVVLLKRCPTISKINAHVMYV